MGQRRRNTVQSRGSVGLTPSRGSSSRLSCPPSTGHLEAAEDTPGPQPLDRKRSQCCP